MENIYDLQKQNIKKELYRFIETLGLPIGTHLMGKSLALLLIYTIRFIDDSDILRYPEFAIDEDFDMCLDWVKDKHNSFSLSINKDGLCAYAYIKQYGVFFKDGRDQKGNGHFKVGSSVFYDFKTSMGIILNDIYHE